MGGLAAPGLDLQRAAPAPREGSSRGAGGFQQHLPTVGPARPQASPEPEVALWATAQHRIGLQPIRRRVWSPRRQRLQASGPHRYQWCDLEAFGQPGTGRTGWLLLPTVSMAALVRARTEFARAIDVGQGTQLLRVLDRAGWHVSPQVQGPPGSHLPFLPPSSPALQPAARLGPLPHEAWAKRHGRDREDLQPAQAPRCFELQTRPARLAGPP